MRCIDADKMIADTKVMKIIAEGIEIDGIIKYLENNSFEADGFPLNIEELNQKLKEELTLDEYQKLSCVMFETLDRLYRMKPKEMEIDRRTTKQD